MVRGARLLAEALQVRGWSQGELERRLGIGDAVASKWLSGRRIPGLANALALQALLGVPADAWTLPRRRRRLVVRVQPKAAT